MLLVREGRAREQCEIHASRREGFRDWRETGRTACARPAKLNLPRWLYEIRPRLRSSGTHANVPSPAPPSAPRAWGRAEGFFRPRHARAPRLALVRHRQNKERARATGRARRKLGQTWYPDGLPA